MWWFLSGEGSTRLEVHDLLLFAVGLLDHSAELIGSIDGRFSEARLVFLHVFAAPAVELAGVSRSP